MDGRRFDEIAKSLATQTSRRVVVRSLAAGLVGGLAGLLRPGSARGSGVLLVGEACASDNDCSGLPGVVCCGADAASGKKGACRLTDVDPANCGACGVTCPADKPLCGPLLGKGRCCSRESGSCDKITDCCLATKSLCCDGICVFNEDASANCGACGRVCKKGEACCDLDCVNLLRDPNHCGTCNLACVAKKKDCCDGRCVDTKTDRKNCGASCSPCRDSPYEVCENGTCVRGKLGAATGATVPNLGYAVLQPSDLGDGYQLRLGKLIEEPAALSSLGFGGDLAEALAPGFQAASYFSYMRPADESGAGASIVSVLRASYESDTAALAAVETMFFSHAGFQADLTFQYPQGNKGYTVLFDGPWPADPASPAATLETGMYVGPMLTVIATASLGGQPDGTVHPEVARLEELFARLVASGQVPDDDDLDDTGLGPIMLRIDGVPEANFFPSRISGEDLSTAGETEETRADVKAAHGKAEHVWLTNFRLPDKPYTILGRTWAFKDARQARDFGKSWPEPVTSTFQRNGITLLEGRSPAIVDNQVAYDFIWPMENGPSFGYLIGFPLDRFFFTFATRDDAADSDEPIDHRVNKARLSAEEIVRQVLEALANAISGTGLPFTLLPPIKQNALIRGEEPETEDQKRADSSSPWSYERGTHVDEHLAIQGEVIDRGERPEKLTCNQAFIIRSLAEDRTIRSCDGYGGPKDRDNAVCKEAVKSAGAMAAKIPCPEDCPLREETEIWRGWRCFEDEPTKGEYSATCAVQLKIVCKPDVQP